MLTPFERYHQALVSGQYFPDPAQAKVVEEFQQLYQNLIYAQEPAYKKWFNKKQLPIKGIYIWGGVGAGKTWLMDLFFASLPLKNKRRSHFHEFMQETHDLMQRWQGRPNPLQKIAEQLAKQIKVLCFDEFFVEDIGDAMILGNLFEALYKQRIVIVATSNVPPDNLYKEGLQRGKFLPTISLIKKNMRVIHVEPHCDYRLRELEEAGVFFYSQKSDDQKKLQHLFQHIAKGEIHENEEMWINYRPIKVKAWAENIIWLDFEIFCNIPRSQQDYLTIAKKYKTVILSNIRALSSDETTIAQYLINLVDIFYDQHVTLILSSAVTVDNIYLDGKVSFEFKRTHSRLREMQSTTYLSRSQQLCLNQ